MSENILTNDARLVEAILFLENERVGLDRLSKMTDLEMPRLELALEELASHCRDTLRGVELVTDQHGAYFSPCADLHEHLRTAYGRKVDRRLSKAALETLSLVANAQPITRREIENIRGVASDSILRLLRDRDYVKIVGHKDVPGRPGLFGTTRKFLYESKLPSISALPQLSDIDKARFMRDEELTDED